MRRSCVFVVSLLAGTVVAGPVHAQVEPPLADRVHKSIKAGVKYLFERQLANGSWEVGQEATLRDEGGLTALATLAVLNAGVPDADRPKLERALTYLRNLKVDSVYARALQTMALAEASIDPRRAEQARRVDLELIRTNVQWLIEARVMNKESKLAGWGYLKISPRTINSSTSQYAVLGLWAAQQAGIEIKSEIWESVRDYYVRTQDPDAGFWIYNPGNEGFGLVGNRDKPSITMSTAGLAGLLIAGMEINAGREKQRAGGADNCGVYDDDENRATAKGLRWLTKNFTVAPASRVFYHLYGLERVGRLSGLRFFGDHDWYREGSAFLVKEQDTVTGAWSLPGEFDKGSVSSTAFALLFLSKGRTPVLISKTIHGTRRFPPIPGKPGFDDLDWNNDRNDLRNLVQYVSKELFKKLPLAWQTYDLSWKGKSPSEAEQTEIVAEMLQSPIFYITGHQSPLERFTDTERILLKRYVESGGFILAEACCSSLAFDDGFRKLVQKTWAPDAELAELPSDHAVWTSFAEVDPGKTYKLMGLNLGCKTVLIYSPQDLSCFWESGNPDKYPMAFKLGANIVAYATGMQPPKVRLTEMPVASNKTPADNTGKRGYLQVGQVSFKGEWNAAPKAMTRVMENVRGFTNVDVVYKPVKVELDDSDLTDYKFLYLHGRIKPGQEPFPRIDEWANLRFNLENGGLLFADACCGDENFDKAFRAFMKALFPKHKLEQVPLNDLLFSAELNGDRNAITDVKCRTDRKAPPQSMAPWLEGIRGEDGRWMVLYSKYDIGCALEGHQSLGCLGYDPGSAMKLARAAVLYNLRP
jgi:hypothetical protein